MKVLALDWGHTLMDERRDRNVPLDDRPAHLMPGVREALAAITLPLAVWANTREGDERHVRAWLTRAGLDGVFSWVITSTDAGARKPSARFFAYALTRCGCTPDDVLFVGNQLNTDVAGANAVRHPQRLAGRRGLPQRRRSPVRRGADLHDREPHRSAGAGSSAASRPVANSSASGGLRRLGTSGCVATRPWFESG